MSQATIAERYARAILELAAESGQLLPVSEQIRNFSRIYSENAELRSILSNPVVEEASRDAILKEVGQRVGASPIALNAVRLMARRGRLMALNEVSDMLTRLADQKAGVLRATVTSAKPLSEEQYQKIAGELAQRTSRKIIIERREDPTLLAGVVTRIGDHTIDGTVRGRLNALARQLLAS